MVKIYTDAARKENVYSWAFAIEDPEDIQYGIIKAECEHIQMAEFISIYYAIYYAYNKYGITKMEILCDNETIVDFMHGKSSLKSVFKHQKELFKLIYSNDLDVEVTYVKGHSGVELNELCDKLCKEILDEYFREN